MRAYMAVRYQLRQNGRDACVYCFSAANAGTTCWTGSRTYAWPKLMLRVVTSHYVFNSINLSGRQALSVHPLS